MEIILYALRILCCISLRLLLILLITMALFFTCVIDLSCFGDGFVLMMDLFAVTTVGRMSLSSELSLLCESKSVSVSLFVSRASVFALSC